MTASVAAPGPANAWWRDGVAWLAAAAGTALTGASAAPANSWLDSAELVACAAELGNIHPPGHPAWLSLAPALHLLPLGPFAWRIALFSALAAGVSLFLLVRLVRLCLGDQGSRALTSAWGLLAAATLLASGSLWQVAVRAEVYTLALAANLWALHAAILAGGLARRREVDPRLVVRYLASAAMAICLGLLNHHYVTLFAVPAVLFAAWPAVVWLSRRFPGAALAIALGCAWLGLGYLALGLRGHADTEMRWGDPSTAGGLWDTLTAKHFQKGITKIHVAFGENALVLTGMVAEAMSLPLALCGLAGLALAGLWRERGQVALWLAFLGGIATKSVLQIDTGNPDDHGYVLMAPALLGVGTAQFAAFLGGRRGVLAHWAEPRRRSLVHVAVLAGLCLAAGQVSVHLEQPRTQLAHLRAPAAVDDELRRALPPGALYLANYYGLGFNEQAFRIAEGRRPDVVAAHLSFRTGDTDGGAAWQAWFAQRHPEWAELALAAAKLRAAPIGNLIPLLETRPIFAEQDPDLRIPPGVFGFDGVASRLLPQAERAIDYDVSAILLRHKAVWERLAAALGPDPGRDGPTRAVLLWQHALAAAHALRRGWLHVAQDELARAEALNPGDRLLAHLRVRADALDQAFGAADAGKFRALWQAWQVQDFATLAAPMP